jgi:hypothetical protein
VGNFRATGEALQNKVKQSHENVRLIQSGKSLIETFKDQEAANPDTISQTTGGSPLHQSKKLNECLPVF